MPTLIRMPEISANAAAAQLVEWLVEEGATVAADDVVASIETDKAVVDLNAGAAGTLVRRLAKAGDQVAVGAAVAVVLGQGERADAVDALLAQDGKKAIANEAATSPAPQTPAAHPPERSFASPLARKLARQAGIPLEELHGSGPLGRVVKRDIERAQAAREAALNQAANPAINPAVNPAFESIPHTPMRATIARRLRESKQHIPHFYLRGKCRMEALYALRAQLNHAGQRDEDLGQERPSSEAHHKHSAAERHGARRFSVNDFIIKAAACTLRDLPDTNVIWTDSAMQRYRQVDIAVAVAIPGGLITPVLHAVETLSLSQLSTTMAELASRARESRLLPHEYQGGTFSISNLGMYGVTEFAAIINPPQSAILAVGASNRVPVVEPDGSLGTGVVMEYTLSVDHRAIDGALAAKWMARFQHYMEHPATMLV
ncbi:2-oxo acid dehydrogenase subunit E2 [Bordetella sp. LUAb4]|uniref:2-oxo acid dehydrogenase subunit E2 n=1 Tax=Bordetella sp. LUAb4 TaxID=2843195 RepID=UPI001E431941|nr:2-oxo acid dehydrogenase subunit E2 [Bordetella sp. LUAb4]